MTEKVKADKIKLVYITKIIIIIIIIIKKL